MDKLKFKKDIIRNAEWFVEQKEADFNKEIDRMKESAVYEPAEQDSMGEKSQDEELRTEITRLNQEMNFAHEQLLHLVGLEKRASLLDRVEPGAIVETDKGTFFISVAIDDFELEGEKIYCISPEAPIYKEMVGKQKGDHFTFRDKKYRIKELF